MNEKEQRSAMSAGCLLAFIVFILFAMIIDIGKRTVKIVNEIGFRDTFISIVDRDLMELEGE